MEYKKALDAVISKSRVHFYKPIQIAEILYRNRVENLDIENLENYRTRSKRWRDDVSLRLVGSASTSSAKFQDNLFEENAVPPRHIQSLASRNRESDGLVEAYIYRSLSAKMNDLQVIHTYLSSANASNFELMTLIDYFTSTPGLRRSMDKVFEIITFSIFRVLVNSLEVQVQVQVATSDEKILTSFQGFGEKVLGLRGEKSKSVPGNIFRVGSTNANDGGIDLWANFGPAIQVKHFALSADLIRDISNGLRVDNCIIVCTDLEKSAMESILLKEKPENPSLSIVTLSDLRNWFATALKPENVIEVGEELVSTLLQEFEREFPINNEMPTFLSERGYDKTKLDDDWAVSF